MTALPRFSSIATAWSPPGARDSDHAVAAMRARRRRGQLFVGEPRTGFGDGHGRPRGGDVELVAEHENAAGDAHQQHVEADADPAPEMDLKNRLAQPEALRLRHPLPPPSHDR